MTPIKKLLEAVAKAYAEDEEWDEVEDPPVEALSGAVGAAGGMEETAGLLLEMLCGTTKLKYLLHEADEVEFKSIAGRLAALRRAVSELPELPRKTAVIGFKVAAKKPGKKKQKGRAKR